MPDAIDEAAGLAAGSAVHALRRERPEIVRLSQTSFDAALRPKDPGNFSRAERAAGMAFAPGALVFPGGRIDPDDRLLGRGDEAAARVAAIRETLEETGIAVAIDPAPDAVLEAELRDALHDGARLSDLLARHGLALRPDDLVPFARWCPTFKEARNFDTRFYLARAPADARVATTNAESVRAFWATAADVLARADAGGAPIVGGRSGASGEG